MMATGQRNDEKCEMHAGAEAAPIGWRAQSGAQG